MRTPLLAANWKMYKTLAETRDYLRDFSKFAAELTTVDFAVFPPLTSVTTAVEAARGSRIAIGAQNLYFERDGAFTGEVSARMIKDTGATHVLVGHSERRRLFGDTDAWVQRKARAAINETLTPIVCIGETLAEREAGDTHTVLDTQIRTGLDGLSGDELARIVIAYEPVWAIGTGRNATPAEAGDAHAHIRKRLAGWFSPVSADRCRILYGGSVKPDNIADLIGMPDVDGALVGGASLEVRSFSEIARRCAR